MAESLADAGIAIGPADFEQAHYAGITAVDQRLSEGEGTLSYLGGYVGHSMFNQRCGLRR